MDLQGFRGRELAMLGRWITYDVGLRATKLGGRLGFRSRAALDFRAILHAKPSTPKLHCKAKKAISQNAQPHQNLEAVKLKTPKPLKV